MTESPSQGLTRSYKGAILRLCTMLLLLAARLVYTTVEAAGAPAKPGSQDALGSGIDPEKYKQACPDYLHYSVVAQYVPGSLCI